MVKILVNNKNVVVHKSETILMDEGKGGYYDVTNDIIFPTVLDLTLIDNAPEDIRLQKDKYIDGKIVTNENYQEPFDIELVVRQQQKIIDQLLIDSLMGGE
jgi:hypothetical protein